MKGISEDKSSTLLDTINIDNSNMSGAKIAFGKYRGMSMAEIFDVDPQYVLWFRKEYKTKPYKDYRGIEMQPKLNDHDIDLKRDADNLAAVYFNKMAENNKAYRLSQYIGSLKDRINTEVVITSITDGYDVDSKKIIGNQSGTDNLIYFYLNRKELWEKCKVGDPLQLIGTITKHIESMGKKMTYLNRVKLISEYTQIEIN
jgi:hypothetical protein